MYLAIDYGKKRVGLAVGSRFPRGIGTITHPGSFSDLANIILSRCRDYDVEKIIIGMPLPQSNQKNELVKEVEKLASIIEKNSGIKVVFEQEAYTSVEAERELINRGIDIRKNKEKTDELAAILILEQYIESKINNSND